MVICNFAYESVVSLPRMAAMSLDVLVFTTSERGCSYEQPAVVKAGYYTSLLGVDTATQLTQPQGQLLSIVISHLTSASLDILVHEKQSSHNNPIDVLCELL